MHDCGPGQKPSRPIPTIKRLRPGNVRNAHRILVWNGWNGLKYLNFWNADVNIKTLLKFIFRIREHRVLIYLPVSPNMTYLRVVVNMVMNIWVLELVRNLVAHDDARVGKWRGNWRMECVASTLTPPPNVVYPALLKLMRTTRMPAVDWTDTPTNLNGLVRFGERRNLVSVRVPSHSARAIHVCVTMWPWGNKLWLLSGCGFDQQLLSITKKWLSRLYYVLRNTATN